MFQWLLRRFLRRAVEPQHGVLDLGDLEALARAGTAGLLLAQEKARLDFLAAQECGALDVLLERLVRLQTTNAVVQALLNERRLEQLLAEEAAPAEFAPGKSR